MEFFKGDAEELKFYNSAAPLLDNLSLQKDLFYEGAYSAAPLGDVIYDTGRSPLSNAIAKSVFRTSFKEIFDAFVLVGTAESYITVFKKIFGDDVVVDFTVPAPGKLGIEITATGLELEAFNERRVVDNEYIYDEMLDLEGDGLFFQTVIGFESQYELEQMLNEMVPDGIFTTISLTTGV